MVNEILSFGEWFAGGEYAFADLAYQMGLVSVNVVSMLWLARWILSIFIDLSRKGGGKL